MSACQVNDNGITGPKPFNNAFCIGTENDKADSVSTMPPMPDVEQATVAEDPPEILGSVVQSHEMENGDKNSSVQLRTSARVSKKMRLDIIANQTPPERKDLPKEEDKLDAKPKRRPFELWPLEDKNTFFEALNEFGKDFDAIQRYFEAKAKRKNLPEHMIKNKEQIRHFYYRTWHKISKHLRFPDETKKATQELYGLINFGELRKKLGSVSEKTSLKLSELIYRGFTTIRVRGKNIRVKTPICRALRKLNQQEDLAEDLKLPTRVTVELQPRTNEAWARVQATAQNPRVQTLLPLQRRLSTLLSYLEQRWQPHTLKHCERLQSQLKEVTANMELTNDAPSTAVDNGVSSPVGLTDGKRNNPDINLSDDLGSRKEFRKPQYILRVAPKSNATITPLTINLSEYFTSSRLSLNSHEGRLGNHAAEQLFNSMLHASKGCGRRGTKRQRNDSSSDKKKELQISQLDSSPEKSKDGSQSGAYTQVENEDEKPSCPFRLFGSGINLDASSSSADSGHGELKVNGESVKSSAKNSGVKDDTDNVQPGSSTIGGNIQDNAVCSVNQQTNSTESNEDVIKRVRSGWNIDNANAATIGELYLMFGADSKVKLEYWWEDRLQSSSPEVTSNVSTDAKDLQSFINKPLLEGLIGQKDQVSPTNQLSLPLKKLLSLAKMCSSQAKCPCGHVCNGTPKSNVPKTKVTRPSRGIIEIDKVLNSDLPPESSAVPPKLSSPSMNDGPFRRPLMPSPHFKPPPRPGTADAFKAQLEKFRPRGCNRRGRPVSVKKNVVVPRILPLLPKAPQTQSVVTFQVLPQNTSVPGDFLPIAQSPSILNFTPTSSSNLLQSSIPQFVHKITEPSPQVVTTTTSTVGPQIAKTIPKVTGADIDISMPDLCESMGTKSKPHVTVQEQSNKNKGDQPHQSCHLVQDLFPPTLDTPVNSPPSISNLLDLSLPCELGLNSSPLMETNFTGLLSSTVGPSSPPPASPSTLLKEDENQWLNAEDFSLSSFLGHLESPMKANPEPLQVSNQQTSITSDVETHMQCLMTETSLDYVAKFADLAAQMASDGASKN